MKKLSIVILCGLCVFLIAPTTQGANCKAAIYHKKCKRPCFLDWGTDLEALCGRRVCRERQGIDLEKECRSIWCQKNYRKTTSDWRGKYRNLNGRI